MYTASYLHLECLVMPKATLSFVLPDEEGEFRDAHEGGAAKTLIWEIDQKCRSVVKYEFEPSEDRVKLAEEIREMIREARGVTIE